MEALCGLPPMRYASRVGKGLQHSSGRVIGLGRLILATLFLLAIWIDHSQPTHQPEATFAILLAYIGFASLIASITWNNWWLDAKLAGPAHAIDILLFTVLVALTEGYTSPFFTFFMFVLLSATIRWNWRATALTALLLALLYSMVGQLGMPSSAPFEVPRFLVRTAHLIILSLILIWFGVNQRWARFDGIDEELVAQPSLDESALESGLRAAMRKVRASTGTFLWRDPGREELAGLAIDDDGVGLVGRPAAQLAGALSSSPFLYDFRRHHALKKDAHRNLISFQPDVLIAPSVSNALKLAEGLAVPICSADGEGLLLLERVSGLSTDHIDLGDQIARDIAAHIQRHALLRAAEESAEARSRLVLARDLHDSVVQFLAGAAFRLEAMKRSNASGRDVDEELNELKQLMLQEQRELRSFIASLRSGPLAAYADLAKDLQALAARLARQWNIECQFSSRSAQIMIPTRLRLDAQQLMREAIANAVRHASAKSITVELATEADELRLEVVNDGADFPRRNGRLEMPVSLKERVDQAGGTLDMARGMGVTKLSIWLPISEAGR
jgi:signal transduction histidine kinase